MSRLAAFTQGPHCATCHGRRVVTFEGERQAEARRCPDCFGRCADCDGRGYVFESDWTGALNATECGCLEVDRRVALYSRAGVPRRYARVDLEAGTEDVSESVRSARLACYRLTAGFEVGTAGIGLTGPVGCGKTHLMAGVIRVLTLENAVPCRFVEFTHLLAELRQAVERGEGSAEIVADVVDVPVLVIDELGKGLSTEWQAATLDELISKRYNSRVSTFFTSNFGVTRPGGGGSRSRDKFDVASLEDRIGPRMTSRLAEMCTVIAIDAPDFRRRPSG